MRVSNAVLAAVCAVSSVLPCSIASGAEIESALESAFFSKTVPGEALQAQRGKAVLTLMDLDGSVRDNAALDNITGQNVITNGAFSNASGVSTMIQNSGNNVLIQNATILQLDVR